MDSYENYISLGYFCEVSEDLQKIGLRDFSYPFDWVISSFPEVINAIQSGFLGFLEYSNLYQSKTNRGIYQDILYKIYFYHDFNKYTSLKDQYQNVREKYDRRIKRFMNDIKKPTLFIRYISSEDKSTNNLSSELVWIESNYEKIIKTLKQHNQKNEVIFIGDETLRSNIIKIYTVYKDKNDSVSRQPIINNNELFPLFSSLHYSKKDLNIKYYKQLIKQRKSLVFITKVKTVLLFNKLFRREYIHPKTF